MEDDCDELPPISVKTRNNDSNKFTMPPADVLASQRAREVECERELELLREIHSSEQMAKQKVRVMRSDSSGSEGDTLLAAAVENLRVEPDSVPSPTASVNLVELIQQLIKYLPENECQFLQDYLAVLQQGNSAAIKFVTSEVLEGIEASLLGYHNVWDPPSVLCCSTWLCALCVGGGSSLGLRLRRALHALLQRATDEQVKTLGHIMSESLQSPQLLLELSDAVQGAPGAPRDLANLLIQLALDKEESLSPTLRCTLVQLNGRAAAAGLIQHISPKRLQLPQSAPRTDRLKVAVGTSKLELLFNRKNEH